MPKLLEKHGRQCKTDIKLYQMLEGCNKEENQQEAFFLKSFISQREEKISKM